MMYPIIKLFTQLVGLIITGQERIMTMVIYKNIAVIALEGTGCQVY